MNHQQKIEELQRLLDDPSMSVTYDEPTDSYVFRMTFVASVAVPQTIIKNARLGNLIPEQRNRLIDMINEQVKIRLRERDLSTGFGKKLRDHFASHLFNWKVSATEDGLTRVYIVHCGAANRDRCDKAIMEFCHGGGQVPQDIDVWPEDIDIWPGGATDNSEVKLRNIAKESTEPYERDEGDAT